MQEAFDEHDLGLHKICPIDGMRAGYVIAVLVIIQCYLACNNNSDCKEQRSNSHFRSQILLIV